MAFSFFFLLMFFGGWSELFMWIPNVTKQKLFCWECRVSPIPEFRARPIPEFGHSKLPILGGDPQGALMWYLHSQRARVENFVEWWYLLYKGFVVVLVPVSVFLVCLFLQSFFFKPSLLMHFQNVLEIHQHLQRHYISSLQVIQISISIY